MTLTVDLGTILTSLLSGGALAGIIAVFRQLRMMNGSIRELQVWTKGHEKLDDERFESQSQHNKDSWESIHAIRDRLGG